MTAIDGVLARLRRLEDERDIARLIASYGPAVDAGDADVAAGLWATDGVCDVDGWQIATRTSRVLDGNPDALALLTKGLAGQS
ncbi:hypothetical protein B8W69_19290 [Mycobacterium vulneris]|jgi:hypothetical protein|uniref:SnoaL-like domain-containing protein n=1 Tax=Mycolicibacterium vulneris TaxID=547163 RepID=A0A1X2KUH9_9MYCO|nr:nuclear transport factor 2 family protein [Mycolicibacterium vulneris]OSC25429.1 hypothetical protein B8W69_19290 [Mycolicibacterium vulneris]